MAILSGRCEGALARIWRSAMLKATTRIGLLYWPVSRFWMTASRSVRPAPKLGRVSQNRRPPNNGLIAIVRHDRGVQLGPRITPLRYHTNLLKGQDAFSSDEELRCRSLRVR